MESNYSGGNGAIEVFNLTKALARQCGLRELGRDAQCAARSSVARLCTDAGSPGFLRCVGRHFREDAVAQDRAEMDAVLALEPDLAALRFRRLASRMAIHVMRAALHPIDALAPHAVLLGRHLQEPSVDSEYLRTLEALQR